MNEDKLREALAIKLHDTWAGGIKAEYLPPHSPWFDVADAARAALSQAPVAVEPYGRVTTHSQTGQQFFFRWPEPPYLDNASECVTVYTAPPAQTQEPT